MNRTRIGVVGATVVSAAFAAQQTFALAQQAPPRKAEISRSAADKDVVVIDGIEFASWADYFSSEYFRTAGKRCATPISPLVEGGEDGGLAGGTSADCGTSTSPGAIYAATTLKYRIPVVFHSITSGATGTLTDAQIQNNVIVLNEDFKAIAGSPGAAGANGQIEFVLTDDFAAALGGGSTTAGTGIMRYNNATWYADGGAYYNTIARTPTVYMNLYSNSPGGALGYVPFLPHTAPASVGTNSDRVVLLWSSIGDPCPVGGVYCTGRTATHEVGHYLGLEHTFAGGCATVAAPGCYSTGDRVCDTNAVQSANFGCSLASADCTDGTDNVRNYMDYSDDTCMNNFTLEQTLRMRCTLEHRRITLPILVNIFQTNFTGTPNILAAATNTTGTTLCDSRTQAGRSDGAGDTLGAYTGNPFVLAGDEVAYRINHPGGDIKVKLTGLSSDLDLMLMTAAGTPVSTFKVSNLGGSASERVVALVAAAGTYYAVVDTFSTHPTNVYGSNFTIRYSRCVADTNDDNAVNVTDLLDVIGAWGSCNWCNPDINDDDAVNVTDLLAVIGGWGACP